MSISDVSANQQTPDHKMADILFEDTEGITHKFRVYNASVFFLL